MVGNKEIRIGLRARRLNIRFSKSKLSIMKSLYILAFSLILNSFAFSQQISMESSTTDYCSVSDKGTIEVTLIKKNISPIQPPYEVEYHNVDTDFYGDYEATENNFTIEDLDAGSYTVTVHLTDELSISTDCPFIDNPNEVVVILKTPSCNDDGTIELLKDNGITYSWRDGASGGIRENLAAGKYYVTATHADNCEAYAEIEIGVTQGEIIHIIKNNCVEGASEGSLAIVSVDKTLVWNPVVSTNTILWFDVAENLANGTYCVTVTDDESGCTASDCYDIETTEPLQFTNIAINDACPNGNLGSISFDIYAGQVQTNFPIDNAGYEITWSDPSFNGEFDRQDLWPGTYTATITDVNGCNSTSYDFVVEWDCNCPSFTDIQGVVAYACSDTGTEGAIKLFSHNESTGISVLGITLHIPFFTFSWSGDHPVTTEIGGRMATGLRPGNYSVTVSHIFSDCEATANFEVEIEQPISITSLDIVPSCGNEGTGTIDLEYTGGSNPNGLDIPLISWDDLPVNSTSRYNLSAGQYCISIDTRCYDDQNFCFNVPEYELSVTLDPQLSTTECDNHSITTSVDGDHPPPYTYEWSNGQDTPVADNLQYAVHTVTVTDSEGCQVTESLELFPIEVLEKIDACSGFNDGSIKVSIPNPPGGEISVSVSVGTTFDGGEQWPLTSNNTDNPVIIELDNLAGAQYLMHIFQRNPFCKFSFPFEIGIDEDETRRYESHRPLEREGQPIPHVFECTYTVICKGNQIPNGEIEMSDFRENIACEQDINGWETALTNLVPGVNSLDCGSVEIFCDDVLVETVRMKPEKIRGGEFENLLKFNPGVCGNGPTFTAHEYFGWEFDPCGRIFVCPQNPLCNLNGGWTGNMVAGDFKGMEPQGNGCLKVKCKRAWLFNNDYELCGTDVLSDAWNLYLKRSDSYINVNLNSDEKIEEEGFKEPCDRFTISIAHLRDAFSGSQFYEGKEGYHDSELEIFLSSFHVEQNSDASYCTDITYCKNDFSIVGPLPNLENVNCDILDMAIEVDGLPPITNTCQPVEGYQNGEPGIWVACDNQLPRFIADNFDIGGLVCDKPTDTQIITTQSENTTFETMSFSTDRFGRQYPNGMYKGTTTNSTYYHHFIDETYEYSYAWKVLYSYNLFNEGYGYYIMGDTLMTNKVQLISGTPDAIVDNVMVGNNLLEIHNLNRFNEEDYLMKGSYDGGLFLNGVDLSGQMTSGEFLMQMKKDGSLGDQHFSSSDNYLKKASQHSSSNFYRVSDSNQNVVIDGSQYSGYQSGSIIEIELLDSVGMTFNTDIRLTGSMNLLASEHKIDNAGKYYMFRGVGDIFYKNARWVTSTSDRVVLMDISEAGHVLKVRYVDDLPNLLNVVNKIELDEDGNLFLAANLGDSEEVQHSDLPSPTGGTDISILKLSPSFTVIEAFHSETITVEVVKDLFYSSGAVFFGGDMENGGFEKEIGDMSFYDFSDNSVLGFMSYFDVRQDREDLDFDCTEDCKGFIQFIPNSCGATAVVTGPDMGNYYLIITGDNGYYNEVGFLDTGTHNYQLRTIGNYEFKFIAANEPCKDALFNVNLPETCFPLIDLCTSINTSASGTDDWTDSFTSDGNGILTLIFNSESVPDQLRVLQNGVPVVDSGPYSTNMNQAQANAGYSGCGAIGGDQDFIAEIDVSTGDEILLEVVADNCSTGYTIWHLDAECSGSSNIHSIYLSNRNRKSEDDAINTLLVYPNPASSILNVETQFIQGFNFDIVGLDGRSVANGFSSGNQLELNITKYNSGVYVITVWNENKVLHSKFTKLK